MGEGVDPGRWCALHVFLSDARRSEDFLIDWAVPQIRSLLARHATSQWFFIRYWEGGPHLRIRLRDVKAADARTLIAAARAAAAERQAATVLSRQEYYGGHGFDGRPLAVQDLPWFPDGSVEAIAYVPELQRYGGDHAMGPSEALFCTSSEIAVAVIGATRDDASRRLAAAMALMAATPVAAGCGADGVAAFFESYAAYWSNYSEATRALAAQLTGRPASKGCHALLAQALAGHAAKPGTHRVQDAWRTGVATLCAELSGLGPQLISPFDGQTAGARGAPMTILNILASQLHMLNNRLGVVPAHELMLAHELASAARSLVAAGHEVSAMARVDP